MEKSCHKFINTLIERTASLQATYRETIDYWEPDEPPVTTMFAALGSRIADDFDSIETDINWITFRLIEEAMAGDDNNLKTAVATGLLEAIIATAWRHEGLWSRISPMLGDMSRKHADAWLAPC